jgi:hypothetical protein
MTDRPSPRFASQVDQDDRLRAIRAQIVRTALRWTFLVYLVAITAAGLYAWANGQLYLLPVYVVLTVVVGVVVLWPQPDYRWQGVSFLGLIYFAVLLNFATEGRGALGRVFILMLVYTAVLLFGLRAGFFALALGLLTMATFGWLFVNNYMVGIPDVTSTDPFGWLSNSIFIFVISLYLILSLYYLLSNLLQTIQQSDTLAQALQAAQETLEARVHERTAAAELALQEAETARATLETQMWFATGEAELNEAMHGEQEIPQLAQNIIIHLCRYLQIPIGAVYLLNNQHMRLELAGAFAYRPAPDAPTSFRVGEGLVGEAAQQRRQLLIQNAPLSLLSLESSLGMDACAYLLLQPIWYEHLLLGVLVFGHWQPFTIAQTEFVQTITRSTAVALHTARTRDYINQLLEQDDRYEI